MAFEKFMRQRAPSTDEPAVTLQKRGTLSLNLAAYEALGAPEAIELFFDRERNLMALSGAEKSAEAAYPLRQLGRGRTWLASGKAFMNYYKIAVDAAQRRVGNLEDNLLVIDLNKPGTDVSLKKNAPIETSERSPAYG